MTCEHAIEDLRAMQETGLRGRFAYGPARSTPLSQPFSIADLARMHGDWASLSNEGLLTLGTVPIVHKHPRSRRDGIR
jgi:5-methylthioadenosine/S-adenosylhomocysteine deaminase